MSTDQLRIPVKPQCKMELSFWFLSLPASVWDLHEQRSTRSGVWLWKQNSKLKPPSWCVKDYTLAGPFTFAHLECTWHAALTGTFVCPCVLILTQAWVSFFDNKNRRLSSTKRASTHKQKCASRPVVCLRWLKTNLMKPKSMAVLFYCCTFPSVILGRREKEHYLKRQKQNKAKSQGLVSWQQ